MPGTVHNCITYLAPSQCIRQPHGIQNEENRVLIVKQSKVTLVEVLLLVDRPRNHVTGLVAVDPQ